MQRKKKHYNNLATYHSRDNKVPFHPAHSRTQRGWRVHPGGHTLQMQLCRLRLHIDLTSWVQAGMNFSFGICENPLYFNHLALLSSHLTYPHLHGAAGISQAEKTGTDSVQNPRQQEEDRGGQHGQRPGQDVGSEGSD